MDGLMNARAAAFLDNPPVKEHLSQFGFRFLRVSENPVYTIEVYIHHNLSIWNESCSREQSPSTLGLALTLAETCSDLIWWCCASNQGVFEVLTLHLKF